MTSSAFWKKWKVPWKHDQCRRRYVEGGDEIGIRQLAKDSGQPKSTLERWSTKELWVDQRRQYSGNLRASVQEKTIEKTSEKLSDELSEIATANYRAHVLARDCAVAVFQIKMQHLKAVGRLSLEEQLEVIDSSHSASAINQWSLIMSRATDGIERATGLPYYINGSAAAKIIESQGYIITRSEGEDENQ